MNKRNKSEEPICKRLKCGCYIEIWKDIQRHDFCEKHARERGISHE